MEKLCPISKNQVDERVAQLNAALTVICILLLLFSRYWIFPVLAVDFLIRGFFNPARSYFSALSKAMRQRFGGRPVMVNAGPKIFAARIGCLFCALIALAALADLRVPYLFLCLVFLACACLEALFRFCLACQLYPLVHRLKNPVDRRP